MDYVVLKAHPLGAQLDTSSCLVSDFGEGKIELGGVASAGRGLDGGHDRFCRPFIGFCGLL